MSATSNTNPPAPSAPSITTSSLPSGQAGIAYSATLVASGGSSPYSWSVSSGSLPAGLTLGTSSGQISGTPGTAGTSSFTIQVTDSSSPAQTASKSLSVTIASSAPGPVSITTSSLPNGQMGTAYSATLAATGGTSPYSWSVTTGSLPAGLALAASTGTISGTPSQSGTFSFTVQVTDASSPAQIASKALSINVAASTPGLLQVTTTSLPNGQVGSSYSASLAATGGTTPYTWSVSTGSLPTGVTLAASTGQITGSPSATGTFTFLIQVTDSSSPAQTATQSFTVTISAAGAATPLIACGSLSSANTRYALQNNLSSAGTCITISANNVALDLNGFTITYDTGAANSVYGITVTNVGSISGAHITSSVAGGGVVQSTACKINLQTQSNTAGHCTGADPIFVGGNTEVDHLILVDYGLDNESLRVQGGSTTSVHDNTICPYHTKSTLNHYSVFGEISLQDPTGVVSVNNNTIGTACSTITGQPNGFGYAGVYIANMNSLTSPMQITNNQVSMAVPVRDGYGILLLCTPSTFQTTPFEIAHNTINQVSGRGIIASGNSSPGAATCVGGGTIHDNNVTVKEAGNEGNSAGDSIGIQCRFGCHDIQIFNNTVNLSVGTGACPSQFFTDQSSDCGGIGIKLMGAAGTDLNLQAYTNTITSTSNSASFVAAGVYGDFTGGPNSFFKNNQITSNSAPIATDPPGGTSGFDGCGRFWNFIGNTITKGSNPQAYATFDTIWYCSPTQTGAVDATGNVLQDNIFQGGAGADDIGQPSFTQTFSYYVKWSLNVTVQNSSGQPVPGVTVAAVATGGGTETISQVTNASGNAQLILTDHFVSGTSVASATTVAYTPHTVTVTATGCKVSTSPLQITMHQTTSQTLVCQ